MNIKEHLNFSLYSTTLLVAGFFIENYVELDVESTVYILAGVGVGSTLPDIDHPNGTLSKVIPFYLLHSVFKKVKINIFKHGGITHTIFINLLITCLGIYLDNYLIYGIAFGYMTHLYIDHVTGNRLSMLFFHLKIKKNKS